MNSVGWKALASFSRKPMDPQVSPLLTSDPHSTSSTWMEKILSPASWRTFRRQTPWLWGYKMANATPSKMVTVLSFRRSTVWQRWTAYHPLKSLPSMGKALRYTSMPPILDAMRGRAWSRAWRCQSKYLSTVWRRVSTIQWLQPNLECSKPRIWDSSAAQSSFISLSAVYGDSSSKMEVVSLATMMRTSKLFSLMLRPSMHPTKIPRVYLSMNLKKK